MRSISLRPLLAKLGVTTIVAAIAFTVQDDSPPVLGSGNSTPGD